MCTQCSYNKRVNQNVVQIMCIFTLQAPSIICSRLQFKILLLFQLEDLKVLRRSPEPLNNVKIGQGQLQLIMKQILFYHILGSQPFWSSDLNNPMNTPSNSPVISEEKMFR